MPMVAFDAQGNQREGYLALPAGGSGKGILVLHAWWGLTDFFKSLCDRLAAQGLAAFAPDLHFGRTASTIDEAQHILDTQDFPAVRATAAAGMHFLQAHPAVQGDKLSAIGFSMGAAFSWMLNSIYPDAFDKIVLFYGESGADLSHSKAKYQCHFGEIDDWEPLDNVKQMQSPNADIYIYPNAYHWFFESNKPDSYHAEAAALAWDRTVKFLLAG